MINFKELIAKEISKNVDLDEKNIMEFIEIPPSKEMGDYAFPCFKLAKVLKKSPIEIAKDLKENINFENNEISNIDVTNVNEKVVSELLQKIISVGNNLGQIQRSAGVVAKRVSACIDGMTTDVAKLGSKLIKIGDTE